MILGRRGDAQADQLIEVVKIQAFELAPEGQTIDPYVDRLRRGPAGPADGDRLGRAGGRVAGLQEHRQGGRPAPDVPRRPAAVLRGLGRQLRLTTRSSAASWCTRTAGMPAADGAGDRVAEYTAKILWDWKEPQSISRAGIRTGHGQVLETLNLPPGIRHPERQGHEHDQAACDQGRGESDGRPAWSWPAPVAGTRKRPGRREAPSKEGGSSPSASRRARRAGVKLPSRHADGSWLSECGDQGFGNRVNAGSDPTV